MKYFAILPIAALAVCVIAILKIVDSSLVPFLNKVNPDTCLLACFISLLIIFGYLLGKNDKRLEQKKTMFQARVCPDGFGYLYSSDNTGFSLNVEERKILLFKATLVKIYCANQIRNCSGEIKGYSYLHKYGGGYATSIGNSLRESSARNNALNQSGITFDVKDIDHPVWFVHCPSKVVLNRQWEILQQFFEGSLPKQAPEQKG